MLFAICGSNKLYISPDFRNCALESYFVIEKPFIIYYESTVLYENHLKSFQNM